MSRTPAFHPSTPPQPDAGLAAWRGADTASSIQPTLRFLDCPGAASSGPARASGDLQQHRLAYWEWNATGDPFAPHVVLCVHGLSRQGRDFDELARALCSGARVICPDMPGRGASDWLSDPSQYAVPLYAADALALIGHVHGEAPIQTLDWVGTSMGGLIGLAVCGAPGLPLPTPVRRLVLNDVGPVLQWEALQRIGSYLGKSVHFASVGEACEGLALISRGFGPHTPAQWEALTRPMLVADGQGYRLHYDPAIAWAFKQLTRESTALSEAMLWGLYDQISAKTLLLRGADSDLLSHSTAIAMTQRGPGAHLIEFPGVGHAPTLVAPDQIDAVTAFLSDTA